MKVKKEIDVCIKNFNNSKYVKIIKNNISKILFSLGLSGVLVFYISQKIKNEFVPYLEKINFKEQFDNIEHIKINVLEINILIIGLLMLILSPLFIKRKNNKEDRLLKISIIVSLIVSIIFLFIIYLSVLVTYNLSAVATLMLYLFLTIIILCFIEIIRYIISWLYMNENKNEINIGIIIYISTYLTITLLIALVVLILAVLIKGTG